MRADRTSRSGQPGSRSPAGPAGPAGQRGQPGSGPSGDGPSLVAQVAIACPLTGWTGQPGQCRWCCKALTGTRTAWCGQRCRRAFEAEHLWTRARARARRRAKRSCELPDCPSPAGTAIEIDHIDAALGAHGRTPACVHHASNLRSLCVPCHRARTAAQATDRALARASARPADR